MGMSNRHEGTGAEPAPAPPGQLDPAAEDEEVAWHDLECGGYSADLPLWRELAREHAPPPHGAILDIGAGSGRVAIDLALRGHRVTALELAPALLGALAARAQGLPLEPVQGDARGMSLPGREYELCLVPMQTIQLFGGPDGRAAFLERARTHLRAGALLCCALVTEPEPFDVGLGDPQPTPEQARIGGRLYVSSPTRVAVERSTITIERVRTTIPAIRPPVLDAIRLDRLSPAELRGEARRAGFRPAGSIEVPPTPDHVGATVVMLRA